MFLVICVPWPLGLSSLFTPVLFWFFFLRRKQAFCIVFFSLEELLAEVNYLNPLKLEWGEMFHLENWLLLSKDGLTFQQTSVSRCLTSDNPVIQ